jgi:hypothetical protein
MADIINNMIEKNTDEIQTSANSLVNEIKKLIKIAFVDVIEHFNKVGETSTTELNNITNNMNILSQENNALKQTVGRLEKDVKDNHFNEENFNKVSIVRELSKQISELNNKNWELETKIKSLEKKISELNTRGSAEITAPTAVEVSVPAPDISPFVATPTSALPEILYKAPEITPVVPEITPKAAATKAKRAPVKKTVALTESVAATTVPDSVTPTVDNSSTTVSASSASVGVVVVNNPAAQPAPETKKKAIRKKAITTAPATATATTDEPVKVPEPEPVAVQEPEPVAVQEPEPEPVAVQEPEPEPVAEEEEIVVVSQPIPVVTNTQSNIKTPTKKYTSDDLCDVATVNDVDYYIYDSIYVFAVIEDSSEPGEFVGNYVAHNNTINFSS